MEPLCATSIPSPVIQNTPLDPAFKERFMPRDSETGGSLTLIRHRLFAIYLLSAQTQYFVRPLDRPTKRIAMLHRLDLARARLDA